MRLFYALLVFSVVLLTPASSQQVGEALVVSACGTPGRTLTAGNLGPTTVDTTGTLCTASSGGGGGSVTQGTVPWVVSNAGTFAVQAAQTGTWTVQPGNTANTTPWLVTGSGVAGTAASGVLTVQGIASMTPLLVTPAANSAVNVAQVNGVTVLTGTGATGTGAQRVTVSTDQATNAGAALVKGGVGVVNGGSTYIATAASQTAAVLQTSTGATGDYLSHCVIYPTSTSPGAVTVFDSTNTAANSSILFPGGASSLSNLAPIAVPVGAVSVNGAWKVTTGSAVSTVCFGKFS